MDSLISLKNNYRSLKTHIITRAYLPWNLLINSKNGSNDSVLFSRTTISMEIFANIRSMETTHRSITIVLHVFHAQHRCQGSFSRGRGRHVQRIHSTFGFAIGHRSQPRFGETCREEKKSRENVCPRTFHMERQISRRGNVFIFDSPASAKCLFHESSSLSPSRRFEYNVSRDSTNAYMNLNRKKFVTEENDVCEFFVFEI